MAGFNTVLSLALRTSAAALLAGSARGSWGGQDDQASRRR